MELIESIIEWTNKNSGFLGLLIFISTVLLGWLSGIFAGLRRKPKLKIEINDGPTFCASFDTGRVYKNNLTHRTAISTYIKVTNVGSAPTDIKSVHIGYKSQNHILPFKWFWLKDITVALSDFVVNLGEDIKVYPFLIQRNQLSENQIDTYLLEGKSCNGIVYHEQIESCGNFLPKIKNNRMRVKVCVVDVYGGTHTSTATINKVTLKAAQRICQKFGETRESLADK
ncbi:hypothetical protein [Pseudoalteromonas sp. NZS11_1]|uniref:hypothetical protein n=1 Tax=Pseudoalteromonas sp. NZS11_1 TaxID=2792070 RepID=UPI0018CDDE71|nr:hypothetical protein [Pseudoalteromonas sp. NZS11_1]MBH0048423.1 hypothetical protein [Pseudoalteromonas sp. NZS11_1]